MTLYEIDRDVATGRRGEYDSDRVQTRLCAGMFIQTSLETAPEALIA